MNQVIHVTVALVFAGVLVMTGTQLFLGDSLGSDYTYFVPRLTFGYFWWLENGAFSIPWFSAAWCGGLPYFADPQVMFYSVPQWLLFVAGPQTSVFVTFVLFSLLGAMGFYFLLTRIFVMNQTLALIGALLFAFNEFFLFRMLIGHLTYHVFPLIPLVTLAITASIRQDGLRAPAMVLLAGVMIAYVVHAGAANFLIPFMLSVLLLLIVYLLVHPDQLGSAVTSYVGAGFIGFLLSLSKIAAAWSFVRWFPRGTLSLGVFDDLTESLMATFTLLFMNPWLTLTEISTEYLIQAQELRFGVTLVPLLLLLAGLLAVPAMIRAVTMTRLLLLAVLMLIMAIPVVLSVDAPALNHLLKQLPYFREMSLAVRWIAMLIPVAIVIPLLMMNQVFQEVGESTRSALAYGLLLITTVLLLVSHLITEKPWDIPYDPATQNNRYHEVRAGGAVPAIAEIVAAPEAKTFANVDDAFLGGGSTQICYQPLFGYELERYPIGKLKEGSVFAEESGYLNLKNPACYLFPEENACKPGGHFSIADRDEAGRFVTNQPFNWRASITLTIANWINLIAVIIVFPMTVIAGLFLLIGRR